nr:LysM peptidoglycan-binding domain-containing protein [uncultured Acetatifactor sp.]
MELPKNITQIGESDPKCKIYVEDYVISYIKQLNLPAQDKDMAVALYGTRKEEKDISYIFLYGACKLDFLQRESRHLSQAQQQEISRLQKKYFPEYQFIGYRLLNGEMVEGFHICEQNVCRYVAGYARFYEKNDSMLAYMLDTRQEEAAPEEVDQEKYNVVKQRQEERKARAEEGAGLVRGEGKRLHKSPEKSSEDVHSEKRKKLTQESSLRKFRFSAAAVFALLCVAGLAAMNGSEKVEELQTAAKEMMAEMTEQKLPDSIGTSEEPMEAVSASAQADTLIAEDKLADALQKENEEAAQAVQNPESDQSAVMASAEETPAQTQEPIQTQEAVQAPESVQTNPPVQEQTSQENVSAAVGETSETGQALETSTDANGESQEAADQQASAQTDGPVGYVIQKGDTLIGISIRQYGTDARVSEICSLNQITNPDDIKIGQKILLP